MNKIYKKNVFLSIVILCGTFFLTSCKTSQNMVYFTDLDSTNVKQIPMAVFEEPVIQSDDILNITIQTLDYDATTAFNQTSQGAGSSSGGAKSAGASSGGSSEPSGVTGFLVNRDGNVEIPILGSIKVAGLTTTQAKDLIKGKAAKYYKDPTVQVRFGNYKITILGEVNHPASYALPNEKVTILDAISMAGDLTLYGRRNHILVMRNNGDKKDIARLDLNSSALIASPYYYLKQNDVVYVEPIKAKASMTNAGRNQLITIGISIVTLIITILR